MVSDNTTHDSCTVAAFIERLIEYLEDKDIEVTHVIEQCDGALNQYKLAQTFFDLAEDVSRYQMRW